MRLLLVLIERRGSMARADWRGRKEWIVASCTATVEEREEHEFLQRRLAYEARHLLRHRINSLRRKLPGRPPTSSMRFRWYRSLPESVSPQVNKLLDMEFARLNCYRVLEQRDRWLRLHSMPDDVLAELDQQELARLVELRDLFEARSQAVRALLAAAGGSWVD
ncbi:hypothetical protein ACWCXH_14450 [Kitasatospora sp. NPDC001660]